MKSVNGSTRVGLALYVGRNLPHPSKKNDNLRGAMMGDDGRLELHILERFLPQAGTSSGGRRSNSQIGADSTMQ
jgi:hypothetical protein